MADITSPTADLTAAERKEHRTSEQLRRRAHDRFISPATQEALSDAIYGTPTMTVFDHQRITEQLAERLKEPEFLNAQSFMKFRVAAVAFVMRQAQLTAEVRAMMPQLSTVAASVPGCRNFGHAAMMTYQRTTEYAGDADDTDALTAWAVQTVRSEAEAVVAFAGWIKDHQKAVVSGIWEVLTTSLDLGIEGVADELAAQVWRWVSLNAVDLMNSEVPIHIRLWRKAHWTARAWRTSRLNEREQMGSLDTLVEHEAGTGKPTTEMVDLGALQNPIIISEMKWTHTDLKRELRRAGPFRANDIYEAVKSLPLAA